MASRLGYSFSEELISKCRSSGRMVALFPHTSRFDFFILFFYALENPLIRRMLYVVVRDLPVNRRFAPFFSRLFNPIWVGKKEPGKPGTVETIVSQLKGNDNFILLISPEGDCEKKDWKSGYFYMAKQLEASLSILGVDFESHSIRMPCIAKPDWNSDSGEILIEYPERNLTPAEQENQQQLISKLGHQISSIDFQVDIQNILQKGMGSILPYNPNKSFVSTRKGQSTIWTPELKILAVVIGILVILIIAKLVRKNAKK